MEFLLLSTECSFEMPMTDEIMIFMHGLMVLRTAFKIPSLSR